MYLCVGSQEGLEPIPANTGYRQGTHCTRCQSITGPHIGTGNTHTHIQAQPLIQPIKSMSTETDGFYIYIFRFRCMLFLFQQNLLKMYNKICNHSTTWNIQQRIYKSLVRSEWKCSISYYTSKKISQNASLQRI